MGGGELKGILGEIAGVMEGIKETLISQNELDKDAAADALKAKQKKKRSLGESALEATKNALQSAGEKILAPVKNVFSEIFDWITAIFLGRVAIRLWDWFSDPANADKIKSIFKFLKDWWPVIVAGIMAIVGPGVTFTVGAIALLMWGVPKIIDAVKSVFGFGKDIDKEIKDGSKQSEDDLTSAQDNLNKEIDAKISEAQKDQPNVEPVEDATPDPDAQQIPAQELNKGGEVKGTGDKDTVPAMLTPGEFVMSKGAVGTWGKDMLEGMNAAGGGTNIPSVAEKPQESKGIKPKTPVVSEYAGGGEVKTDGLFDGILGFRGGGVVPGDDKNDKKEEKKPQGLMRGLAGAADFLTGGIFDFDKRGSMVDGVKNMMGGGGGGSSFAKDMIMEHEGLRTDVYKDSKGFLTVGYGHLIDMGSPKDIQKLQEGDSITEERAHQLFEQDYNEHKDAATKIPGYNQADEKQQAALIDLTFNMGPDWHKDFPKFTAAFKAGNYELAGAELENSKWYGDVARRAPTIVSLIKGKGLPQGSYLGGKDGVQGAQGLGGKDGAQGAAAAVSGAGGGRYEGSSSTPAKVTAPPPVTSINPPTKPSSTVAYAHQHEQSQSQDEQSLPGADSNGNIPDFDAGIMISQDKIRTLGIAI